MNPEGYSSSIQQHGTKAGWGLDGTTLLARQFQRQFRLSGSVKVEDKRKVSLKAAPIPQTNPGEEEELAMWETGL